VALNRYGGGDCDEEIGCRELGCTTARAWLARCPLFLPTWAAAFLKAKGLVCAVRQMILLNFQRHNLEREPHEQAKMLPTQLPADTR
jgi:hypothetical protein